MEIHSSDKLGVFIRCCIRHFPVYVTKKFELLSGNDENIPAKNT